MFSFIETNSDDDDFGAVSSGLSNVFGSDERSKPETQANKQNKPLQTPFQNKDEKDEKNQGLVQGYEPMSNIHAGVKMATAVHVYKFENNGFKSLGKLGLAIIGNKESQFYQLLLYRGKQQPVAVANITTTLNLNIQPNNYANFVDDIKNSWTVGFESQDVLINFAKQVLLCKTVYRFEDTLECDLNHGEGRSVDIGDIVELNLTGWSVENQSIGLMKENLTGKKCKVGSPGYTGWENSIKGMKKGGRKFLIMHCPENPDVSLAYDLQVTRTKTRETEIKNSFQDNSSQVVSSTSEISNQDKILTKVKHIGHNVFNQRQNLTPELPELEPIRSEEGTRNNRSGVQEEHKETVRRQSIQSNHSASCPGALFQCRPEMRYEMSRQELNLLLSETRISNTEMRMNMTRISDKVDELLRRTGNPGSVPSDTFTEMKRDLDTIKLQTFDIKSSLGAGKTVRSTTNNPGDQEQVRNQAEKIKKLMMLLEEKDEQLQELEQLKEEERVQAENQEELLHRLQDCESALNRARTESNREIYSEMKKVLNSSAKFLLGQFDKNETYSGEDIQATIQEIFQAVSARVQEKYSEPYSEEKEKYYSTNLDLDTEEEESVRDVPINMISKHANSL